MIITALQWCVLLETIKEWHPEPDLFASWFAEPINIRENQVRITLEILEEE